MARTVKTAGRHTKKKKAGRRLWIIPAALAAAGILYILAASAFSLPGGVIPGLSVKQPAVTAAGNIARFDYSCLSEKGGFKTYSDAENGISSRIGIDVSLWQGEIDWEKVKEQGVEFVMIRIGYSGYVNGAIAPDDNFQNNISGAIAAGLDVGVYFYSQAVNETEARSEARYILQHIKGYELTMPIVYDPEEYTADTARTDGLTGEEVTANCIAFCETVEEARYTPMVYTNNYWATSFLDMEKLSEYPIWYADYNDIPILSGGFALWQYSSEGMLEGIESTYVDLNLQFIFEDREK